MSFWNQLGELARSLVTIDQEMKHLRETLQAVQEENRSIQEDFKVVVREIGDLKVRLTRLETSRDTDRQSVENLLVRFQLEVERAELRLKQLPPSSTEP